MHRSKGLHFAFEGQSLSPGVDFHVSEFYFWAWLSEVTTATLCLIVATGSRLSLRRVSTVIQDCTKIVHHHTLKCVTSWSCFVRLIVARHPWRCGSQAWGLRTSLLAHRWLVHNDTCSDPIVRCAHSHWPPYPLAVNLRTTDCSFDKILLCCSNLHVCQLMLSESGKNC